MSARGWCERCGGRGPVQTVHTSIQTCSPVQTAHSSTQTDDSSLIQLITALQLELAWTRDQLKAALQIRAVTDQQPKHLQPTDHEPVSQKNKCFPKQQIPGKQAAQPRRNLPDSSTAVTTGFLPTYVDSVKEEPEQLQPQCSAQPLPAPLRQFPIGSQSRHRSDSCVLSQGPASGSDSISSIGSCSGPADAVLRTSSPLASPAPRCGDTSAAEGEEKPKPTAVAGKPHEPGSKLLTRASRAKGRPFPCPCCDKAFFTEKAMIKHRLRHQEGKPLACSVCQRRYRNLDSLRRHENAAHGLGPALHCPRCGKAFGTRTQLQTHLLTHTGEKPHACKQCDQRFTQRGGLIAHERSHHMAKRPLHLCPTCGRAFTTPSCLKDHMRIHSDERPFVCDVCGHGFRHRPGLISHRRIHSDERPFRCKVCGRGFKSQPTLYGHSKTHVAERPFECSVCGKAFARKTSLTQHQLLHSGERPHQCADCGRGFTRASRLAEHRRIAHGQAAAPSRTAATALPAANSGQDMGSQEG